MITLYVVPIFFWPMLGKESRYFYTRHPNNDDRWFNIIFGAALVQVNKYLSLTQLFIN